jgi:hypothetical protein
MNGIKREKLTIMILGCEHRVQLVENESDQKFRQLVENVIEQNGVRFIGEEAEQGKRSIAQEIAEKGSVKYKNIDIPHAVQAEIRLRPHMKFNRTTRLVEVVVDSDKYVLAWNLVREYHMYKTFEDALAGVEPSLLICGRSHVTGFTELFGDRYRVIPICFDRNSDTGRSTGGAAIFVRSENAYFRMKPRKRAISEKGSLAP